MKYKSNTNVALILTILSFTGTRVAIAQSDLESYLVPNGFDEQSTQEYNDIQLPSYAVERIDYALQGSIECDSEKAQEHLAISSKQIATVLGRIHAASQAPEYR